MTGVRRQGRCGVVSKSNGGDKNGKSLRKLDATELSERRECRDSIGCAAIDYWGSCEGHLEASGMSAKVGLALAPDAPPLEIPPHTASFSL